MEEAKKKKKRDISQVTEFGKVVDRNATSQRSETDGLKRQTRTRTIPACPATPKHACTQPRIDTQLFVQHETVN